MHLFRTGAWKDWGDIEISSTFIIRKNKIFKISDKKISSPRFQIFKIQEMNIQNRYLIRIKK